MKTLPIALAALFAISFSAQAQAPVGPGSVKLGKIAPEFVKTPEFQLSSGPTKRTGRVQSWLEIEIEYETKPEVIPELTFKFTVQFGKKLTSGEVTYVNIPQQRDHFAVMYVSPRGLNSVTGGKVTPNVVDNVWVEVSHQGQKLAEVIAWKQGNIPNAQQLTGLLLNKNQTPFAPLFYDRYEEIKATTR